MHATLSQWVLQWKADPKSPLWNEYGIRLMLPKAGKPAGNTRVPSPSTTTRRYLGGFSEPGSSLHAGTVDDSGSHIFNSIRRAIKSDWWIRAGGCLCCVEAALVALIGRWHWKETETPRAIDYQWFLQERERNSMPRRDFLPGVAAACKGRMK